MKFQIERELLLSNLNHVSRAVSTKPQMPILTGIKIDAKNEELVLTASNSDISIQVKIASSDKLNIEETGSAVIPGKYFFEIIRKSDSKNVYIASFEVNSVKIIANQSSFTLNTLDKTIFPYISFDDAKSFVYLDAQNMKQIIKKTSFATSLSEAKMVLTGVNFTLSNNKLEAIATDSFRLAKRYLEFDEDRGSMKAIIPSKSLDELNKIIEDNQELVQIHFTQSKALFKYKNILFQTRLIDGNFPNTKSLIPSEYITDVKFNKTELVNSIDRASLFNANEVSNVILFNLNSDGEAIISSSANEIGASTEKLIPLECTKNIDFATAFSSKYFLEALKAFDSDTVTIHFTGEIKPFIITSDQDLNHLQLILPIRVW